MRYKNNIGPQVRRLRYALGWSQSDFAAKLRQAGVMVSISGTWRGRACLHLDVTAAHVEEALTVMRGVV